VDGGIERALGLQSLSRTSVTIFQGGLAWEVVHADLMFDGGRFRGSLGYGLAADARSR
jgi:hypothetical protein